MDGALAWLQEGAQKAAWFVLGALGKAAWDHRTRLVNALMCVVPFGWLWVRLSASSVIRIELDGRFLLVRGHRIQHQFQPVGGVYKYFPDGKARLDRMGFRLDPNVPIDADSRNDLRIQVRGWRFPSLLRWFDGSRGRECSPWREFFEELVRPGYVDGTVFPHAQFRYVKRKETLLHWSEHFQVWEVLVADVFELVPDANQEKELRRLMTQQSNDFAWIADDVIRRGAFPVGELSKSSISPTCRWIV